VTTSDLHIGGPEDFSARFGVSRETLGKLGAYERLLRQWQKAVNLVAPSTLDDVWHRHFADSAQLVGLARPARSWIDLGSGAGFPGLVIAILLSEKKGAEVTLVESDKRKCAFLREVARQTGVAVEILSIRIESLATQGNLQPPDVISARALAPLDRLLGLAGPLFASSTVGLFLKGREAAKEAEMAARQWNFSLELVPSLTQPDGRIAVVRHPEPKPKD
jgi:16S rRNA (guanine527-N7)-methyltransferase